MEPSPGWAFKSYSLQLTIFFLVRDLVLHFYYAFLCITTVFIMHSYALQLCLLCILMHYNCVYYAYLCITTVFIMHSYALQLCLLCILMHYNRVYYAFLCITTVFTKPHTKFWYSLQGDCPTAIFVSSRLYSDIISCAEYWVPNYSRPTSWRWHQ
jgi:hypothetical protein